MSIKFDPCLGLLASINMPYENVPRWIREIPGHLKTQEMGNVAVHIEPYSLEAAQDHLKTHKMCNKAVHSEPSPLYYVTGLRHKR